MVARIKALHAGIVLAGGLFVSSSALGLVLGDLTLSSALNEPLEASIELGDLGGLDANSITVTVGDQAAYDRANVERPPFLDDIRFTVEVDNANEGRIVLTSTAGVTEPFLNLIVAVAEPDNVTLKDYTLLVELPADSEVSQAQATPPAAGAATAASASPGTYVIGSGDTLWEIALNTRPDSSVSVQQMMVAIQRANSDAFIDNNINRLINGRVLRIPALQDIRVIDQQSAVAQVSQQSAALGGQPLAVGNTAAGGGAAAPRDQLRVLSGDAEIDAGGGSSDLAATIAALESELMLSEENLDRARIENLELNNRLSSLQEQIDLLENIIAIEDGRIAELQAELARQTAATEQALASADTAVTQLSDISEEPPSGLTGMLRNSVVLFGALFVLVLAFLGFLVYRRRQAQAAAEERSFNPAFDDDTLDDVETPGLLAGLLARFRRDKDADDDDDDYEAEARGGERQEPLMSAEPQPVAPPKKDSTDHLLDEMGISEEMLSLDDALDSVDSAATEQAADVFEPVDADMLADTAESEAVAQSRDSDYALTAADEAFAAIDKDEAEDELVDFTTTEEVAPVDVPAEAAPHADTDTFEFTLKDLPEVESTPLTTASTTPDVETFDFKLTKPVVAQPERTVVAAPENIEVIAFPGKAPAKSEPVMEEDDLLDLGDLSFDDTMVADDAEEDSPYKPRTGNECDTKLDLATAYEAMGDVAEAIEILDEVIAEGTPAQVETAQGLKQAWQSS